MLQKITITRTQEAKDILRDLLSNKTRAATIATLKQQPKPTKPGEAGGSYAKGAVTILS